MSHARNLLLILGVLLVTYGCGGDGGDGGGTDAAVARDSGGGGDEDAGGGGDEDAGGGGDEDAGGGDEDAGGGGDEDGGMSTAAAFCGSYETTCTYGGAMRFADEAACLAYYDGASMACQTCITTHLTLAGTMGAAVHCPHAMGMGPCDADCP